MEPSMIRIEPFTAWIYQGAPEHIAHCLAPPYDLIDARLYHQLVAQCPNNIVRIDLPMMDATTSGDPDYVRARQQLRAWIRQGVLRSTGGPAIYWHRHRFRTPQSDRMERNGLIVRVRVELGTPKEILPHEQIKPEPLRDRERLMAITGLQASPVMLLTDAHWDSIDQVRSLLDHQPPLLNIHTDGEQHTIWAIRDSTVMHTLQDVLRDHTVLIADGHHRYAAARRIARRRADIPCCQTILAFITTIQWPGTLQFGYHRLVTFHAPVDRTAMMRHLEAYFLLEDTFDLSGPDALARRMGEDLRDHRILTITPDPLRVYRWRIRPNASVPADVAAQPTVRYVEETFFRRILENAFGLSAEQYRVAYTPWPHEIVDALTRHRAHLAIAVPPIPVADLFAMARQGKRVPPKSTYFYPKLPAGLLMDIHLHD